MLLFLFFIWLIYYGYKKITFFKINRFYLLFSLIFSAVYPFINLTDLSTTSQSIDSQKPMLSPDWQQIQFAIERLGVHKIYEVLFWISVALFALRLMVKLVGLFRIHLKSIPAQWTIYSYRITYEINSPFHFGKTFI